MSRRKVFAALFIVAGILFFAIPIVYYYTGMRETKKLTQEFEQNLEEVQEDETEMEETGEEETEATGRSEDAAIFAEGDVIAILEIEALGIRYPVVEGCSSSNLNKAIGHMSETGRIGEKGNCVLCGHNGSRYGEFFTNLNKVSIGDIVTILDTEGVFHSYEVTETFVVGPFDHSNRTQGESEELTLFTCAEKGTKRFVVKCAPASEEGAYEE